jgi:hypothetical protein
MSYKFRKHLQKLYIRNENNIHVNLFANVEAATLMMELELHGPNLKMLHNMQRYKTIRIRQKF